MSLIDDGRVPVPSPADVHQSAPMVRAVLTIGVLQFLSMCLLFGRTKIVALLLGPEAVGTMSVVDRLTALVSQTLSLSLPFAALRFLPAALRESHAVRNILYRQMLSVSLALILPATAICVGLSVLRPGFWGADLAPYRLTVLVAFCGLPVIGLVPFLTNAYAGGLNHGRSMWFTIAHSGSLFLGAIVAAFGPGLVGYYGTYAFIGVILVTIAARQLAWSEPHHEHPRLSLRDRFRLPMPVWRFAAALLALTFAAPYGTLYMQYTSLHLYGAAASGILQSAVGISLTVRTLLGTAHAIFLTPQVNRQGDPAARMAWANEFQRVTALLFVLALPPLLLFADIALRVLYSSQFLSASSFVALFVAAEVVTLLSGTYQALIIAGDRMLFHVVQNLAAQALLVATVAVAMPRIGLAGAGLAALAAPLFLYATTLIFLRRLYDVRVSREAAWMAMLASAILVVCGAIGVRYQGLSALVLGAKLVACVATWAVAYILMPADDRTRLLDGLTRGWTLLGARATRGGAAR
jgi:O-antigen/teichoic acid export membrane protein